MGVAVTVYFPLCALGMLASLVFPRERLPAILAWFGSLAAIALAWSGAGALLGSAAERFPLWNLPPFGRLGLALDPLSAVFVAISGLVLLPASLFAASASGEADEKPPRSFNLLVLGLYASIALVFLAGDVVGFLIAWEAMSIFAYLLIAASREDENGQAGAGYLLLAAGEAGTLAAAVAFLLLATGAGSFGFGAIAAAAGHFGAGARWAVFLLSFFGFGVKAGLVPANFWLPRAYVSAPRGFVPILAGATLNLGLYGIVRVNAALLPATGIGPGLVILVIGTLSALLGILYATTDNDLKRMLAHSSIENAGIVMASFGAGSVFVASDHPVIGAIAFAASLYHLINHSAYKTLLFCGAGVIDAQAGTRDMDRLGGLIKAMPLTAAAFLVGALSIAGLPPFNGFVSEWLTLQTMLRSAELGSAAVKVVFALCGAGLALTAALAVTCFVKAFAMSFLGMRRLEPVRRLSEPRIGALAPMLLLAVLCLGLGVLPTYVIPALDHAVRPLAGASAADALVPPFFASQPGAGALPASFAVEFHDLGAQVGREVLPGRGLVVLHRGGAANPVVFAMSTAYMFLVLLGLLGIAFIVIRVWLTRDRRLTRRVRWDGGVRRLLPEMTYTATGFSNSVRVIFDAVFRPTTVEDTRETVAEHFRSAIRREKERVHLVDKLVLRPGEAVALWIAAKLAAMHHGRINAYLTYALLALLVVWIAMTLVPAS